jgi:hypothetical protein
MATKGVLDGRPVGRGPRPSKRRRGLVLAAAGAGWSLWVPVDQWDSMTDQERADRAAGQSALLEGGKSAA